MADLELPQGEPCDLPEPLRKAFQDLHDRTIDMMNAYVAEHDLVTIHGEEAIEHMLFHVVTLNLAAFYEETFRQAGEEGLQETFKALYGEVYEILKLEGGHHHDDE